MQDDTLRMLNLIAQTIYDKKGFNILVLDVIEVSTLTNYFVIAEGQVDRHVKSLANALIEALNEEGEKPVHVEGLDVGDWVVLDYGAWVIHLFTPEWRSKYRLEELWSDGQIVDVDIKIAESKVKSEK